MDALMNPRFMVPPLGVELGVLSVRRGNERRLRFLYSSPFGPAMAGAHRFAGDGTDTENQSGTARATFHETRVGARDRRVTQPQPFALAEIGADHLDDAGVAGAARGSGDALAGLRVEEHRLRQVEDERHVLPRRSEEHTSELQSRENLV